MYINYIIEIIILSSENPNACMYFFVARCYIILGIYYARSDLGRNNNIMYLQPTTRYNYYILLACLIPYSSVTAITRGMVGE